MSTIACAEHPTAGSGHVLRDAVAVRAFGGACFEPFRPVTKRVEFDEEVSRGLNEGVGIRGVTIGIDPKIAAANRCPWAVG